MSDRMAVMNAGRIAQIGAPRDVYTEPADTYVADFLGTSNLMEVDVVERGPGSGCRMKLGDLALVAERGEGEGAGGASAPGGGHPRGRGGGRAGVGGRFCCLSPNLVCPVWWSGWSS